MQSIFNKAGGGASLTIFASDGWSDLLISWILYFNWAISRSRIYFQLIKKAFKTTSRDAVKLSLKLTINKYFPNVGNIHSWNTSLVVNVVLFSDFELVLCTAWFSYFLLIFGTNWYLEVSQNPSQHSWGIHRDFKL